MCVAFLQTLAIVKRRKILSEKLQEQWKELSVPYEHFRRTSILDIHCIHPLFSSLPESVLTSLVTKFELRTLDRHETLIKNVDSKMKKDSLHFDEMYVVASGRFEVYLELSLEESRLEVIRQRKKRENGAGDVLKRIVRKRKGKSGSDEDSGGMKNSSVLKRILGHVDLTKFRWYGLV